MNPKEERFLFLVHHMLIQEIKQNIKSFQPVTRNGWTIQFSVVHGQILVCVISEHTFQTIISYHTEEDEAATFISQILATNSKKII